MRERLWRAHLPPELPRTGEFDLGIARAPVPTVGRIQSVRHDTPLRSSTIGSGSARVTRRDDARDRAQLPSIMRAPSQSLLAATVGSTTAGNEKICEVVTDRAVPADRDPRFSPASAAWCYDLRMAKPVFAILEVPSAPATVCSPRGKVHEAP
jgi:hypothetical protein